MNKEFARIQLKEGFKKREVSVGPNTLAAVPGKPIRVPLEDLQMWLNTGKFDHLDEPEADGSNLPQDIPARVVLVKEGKSLEDVQDLTVQQLEEINGIGKGFAAQIYQYLHPGTPGAGGDEN